MNKLTEQAMELLDKLFNLKGDDNILIRDINNNIAETNDGIKQAIEEFDTNSNNKNETVSRLEIFKDQVAKFEEIFDGLSNDTFSSLRDINVNVDVDTYFNTIHENAPKHIDELNKEIKELGENMDTASSTKVDLEMRLEGLEKQLEYEEINREKLVSLLDQSLSSEREEQEAINIYYIKKVLERFHQFNEDEMHSLSKLIIFPEDGLKEYSLNYKNRLEELKNNEEKAVVEEEPIFKETNPESTNDFNSVTITNEDVVASDNVKDAVAIIDSTNKANDTYEDDLEKTTIIGLNNLNYDDDEEESSAEPTLGPSINIEETSEPVPEVAPIITEPTDSELLNEKLNDLGLDLDKFKKMNTNSDELMESLTNTQEDVIRTNYEILRSIDKVEPNVTYLSKDNYLYVTDEDLNKKITLLRAKGISESVIAELINDYESGLQKPLSEIETNIETIEKYKKELTDDNVNLIKNDLTLYEHNLEILSEDGIELEDSQLDKVENILLESTNIQEDLDILKEYLIAILRKNGKYALEVFWKSPIELLHDIDDLIEADLEDIMNTNPEVLTLNATPLIRRVKFCEENGHPVFEGSDKVKFCDYIIDPVKFANKFVNQELPILVDREATNGNLPEIIGNKEVVKELVEILDGYYATKPLDLKFELDLEVNSKLEELEKLSKEKFNLISAGKYAYKKDNVNISKEKYIRNLSAILNVKGANIDNIENEIILTSLLYNLRENEETLRRLVSQELGGNE